MNGPQQILWARPQAHEGSVLGVEPPAATSALGPMGVWNSGFEMQGFRGLGCRVRVRELWARGGGLNFGALGLGFRDFLEGLALVSSDGGLKSKTSKP